jgi:hypothetical protein
MHCQWIIFINHCILLNLIARVTSFFTTCRVWIQVPFRNSLHLKIDASSIRCAVTACRTRKSPAVLWLMQSLQRPRFDPRDLYWAKWHRGRFYSDDLTFPLSSSFHQCSKFIFYSDDLSFPLSSSFHHCSKFIFY